MSKDGLPVLSIGDLKICPPIIQGGMGIRVSVAGLASAVANTGCVGVIASTGIGVFEDYVGDDLRSFNAEAMRGEIRKAKEMSDGIIGVNIMVALSDYEQLVSTAIEEDVDMIIAGAGLPLDLPKFLNGKNTKLVPIVSSAKALRLICKRWVGRYDKQPDAVIVEGFKAGGHLGYSAESLENGTAQSLEEIVTEVVEFANTLDNPIPVIAAGGIFDGADIAKFLKMGASGVQMGTRFVCTDECDASDGFKQAYLDATEDDVALIKSPVGLPGRVVKNEFVKRINSGTKLPYKCKYKCLRTCTPGKAPYCIANVLSDAAAGKLDNAFAFAGSNVYKCNEIIPVKELVEKLSDELRMALKECSAGSQCGK